LQARYEFLGLFIYADAHVKRGSADWQKGMSLFSKSYVFNRRMSGMMGTVKPKKKPR